MAVDIAEVFGARHQPDFGNMRFGGFIEMQKDRQHHPAGHPQFDPAAQGDQHGGQHGSEIGFGIAPCLFQDREIHQCQHGHDDRRGQGRLRQKEDQRRQRQCGHGQTHGGIGPRRRCLRPCVKVHHRPRKPARDRIAPRKGRADIGRPQTNQLLIRIDPLTPFRGKRLRDRDGFNKPDDRDQKSRQQQAAHQIERQVRQRQRWQALRHGTHNLDALPRKIKGPDRQCGDNHRRHGPRLGRHIRRPRTHTARAQERFQPLAHPEQKQRRGHANHHRRPVHHAQIGPDRHQQLCQIAARGINAQNMLDLAGGDDHTRGGDKARDHRVGQEIRQKPQLEHPHHQQHHPRQQGQRQRGDGIAHRALISDIAQGGGCHQRHHRHRPHRQGAAGAKDGIKQDRHDRRIEPRFGRQPRQQRIGQRLRDQHDRDDHRRDQIIGQGRLVIVAPPVEDGQIAAGSGRDTHLITTRSPAP